MRIFRRLAVCKELIMQELPTRMCHASTLLRLNDGTILCSWFGGSREGAADVGIWLARHSSSGWQKPLLRASGTAAHWNPVLALIDTRIMLFYKVGAHIKSWQTWVIESCDNGSSWSQPRQLVDGDTSGGRGPVRNKLLQLANGRLLAGGSTEQGIWQAFVDTSEDGGRSWQKSQPIMITGLRSSGERTVARDKSAIPVSEQSFYGRGVIQPALWSSDSGMLHMLLRSTEGSLYRSDSEDSGQSWSSAYAIDFPNNNSGIDLVLSKADGALYLVCNPVADNWGQRSPLSLFRSADNGRSWVKLLDLDSGDGEFSYPAIIEASGTLYITYTYQRQNIAFWQVPIDEVCRGVIV